ncbi:uncharacterized protein [Macrobrachium rosenbergii]|uniref:uncharacterized protein n=1 Tax=Macrobrachium rosenbergii TaxID=79674 RepID=UPI0034D3F896
MSLFGKVSFVVNILLALIRLGSVILFVIGNVTQHLVRFIGKNAMALILGGLLGSVYDKYTKEMKTDQLARDAIARLEDDVYYATEMISLLKEARKEAEEENSSLLQEADERRKTIAEYEDALTRKGMEVDKLKEQLADKNQECDRNREKLEELLRQASDNDFYCGYLEEKVKAHEEERKKMKQETKELEDKWQASQQEQLVLARNHLRKKHGNLAIQKNVRILEDRLQFLQRENENLKEKLSEGERQMSSIKNSTTSEKNKNKALVEENRVLRDKIALYQEDCDVVVESALRCASNSELDKAEMLLTQVLDRSPNHERALKGKEFLEQRMIWDSIPLMIDECQFDAVLERITHAQSLESVSPQVHVDLARMKGNIFCKLQRLQEASECFLSVLDKDEDQVDCRLRLALCLLLLGRHAEAMVHLQELDEHQEDLVALIITAETLERMELHGCPYYVLGIAEDANLKEIGWAYRKRALRFNPDRCQGSRAERERRTEIMQKINLANDILRDADEREKYDTLRDFVKDFADKLFEDPKFSDE